MTVHIVAVDVNGKTPSSARYGNQAGTQLWERSEGLRPLVKERGRKGSARVTALAITDTYRHPRHAAHGRREDNLPGRKLFSRPVGDDRFHGLLGMDVLSQATEVTIDFRSMILTLR
jgi:hypothetical protein